jgi:hypothetical protein
MAKVESFANIKLKFAGKDNNHALHANFTYISHSHALDSSL